MSRKLGLNLAGVAEVIDCKRVEKERDGRRTVYWMLELEWQGQGGGGRFYLEDDPQVSKGDVVEMTFRAQADGFSWRLRVDSVVIVDTAVHAFGPSQTTVKAPPTAAPAVTNGTRPIAQPTGRVGV